MAKNKSDEEKIKKKEKEQKRKEARDHENKKKMIAEYKQKKLLTEELLANADLDGISGGQDEYSNAKFDLEDDSNEEDANAVMDQMIEQYQNKTAKPKRPPAVS